MVRRLLVSKRVRRLVDLAGRFVVLGPLAEDGREAPARRRGRAAGALESVQKVFTAMDNEMRVGP